MGGWMDGRIDGGRIMDGWMDGWGKDGGMDDWAGPYMEHTPVLLSFGSDLWRRSSQTRLTNRVGAVDADVIKSLCGRTRRGDTHTHTHTHTHRKQRRTPSRGPDGAAP